MAAAKKPAKKAAKKSAVKKASPPRKAPLAPKSAKKKAGGTTATKAATPALPSLLIKPRKWKIYMESAAFFPTNSSEGYVDHYQSGRRSATQDGQLAAALPIPVGAKLLSISIHYTNTTSQQKMAVFLRKHQDRHSPSGEIEMSFINLPNTLLPPDNYLTVTDTSFPDSGVIQDKFLHYISVPTGDWGVAGRVTLRGVSLVYQY